MKIVTDLKEANSLLQAYNGAIFQIAFYNESLKRIAIRVCSSNTKDVIYFVGIGCEGIRGEFRLSNVNLSISAGVDPKTKEAITKLHDSVSGFELYTSGGFSLAQGLESEFGSSFDNFIKGEK